MYFVLEFALNIGMCTEYFDLHRVYVGSELITGMCTEHCDVH